MKKILIIYTGGTIGMIHHPETYELIPFDFSHFKTQVPEINKFDIDIDTYECKEIIDSSDLSPELWQNLAEIIYDNYNKYFGFVILHGTDTMAYTASALSFMLDNLAKPVIITGAQLPIGKLRTDGKENLISAIEIAADERYGKPVVQEVCIYFEYKLLRGNRTTKKSAEYFDAFCSPNFPSLADAGININYKKNLLLKSKQQKKFTINTQLDKNIFIIKIFPGINLDIISAIIDNPNVKAIILETYGAGNAPTNPDFLKLIKKGIKKGILFLNVSQCLEGKVDMTKYKTGKSLKKVGVISLRDSTIEAAVTKAMWLLGQDFSIEKIRRFLNKSLKGEINLQ